MPAEVVAATAGKLGASLPQCRNLTDDARAKGARPPARRPPQQGRDAYAHLVPVMLELQAAGKSLPEIAAALNAQGHTTRRAKPWNKTQVKRVLDRTRPA